MGLVNLILRRPQERDVDLLGNRVLQLVEAARAKHATKLATTLSRSYARLYSNRSTTVRARLIEFTQTVLSDMLLRLREPQIREVSPGVKMEVENTCVLEHMALFTFLALTCERGNFPEIEELYQRELRAQSQSSTTRSRPREIIVDFAQAMEAAKRADRGPH